MQDNRSFPSDEELRLLGALQALNIAANGRWFILALVAIAIAADDLRTAVFCAGVLGASVIIEQLKPWHRRPLVYSIYGLAALALVILAVRVL